MRIRTFKYTLCAVAIAVATIAMAMIAYCVMDHRVDAQKRLEANIAEMARIDEILTSSAVIATATGDMAFHERYYAHVDALNALLRESIDMFDSRTAKSRLNHTQKANDWLVATEKKALEAMRDGPAPDAYALLRSDDYARHKQDYADGLKSSMSALETQAEAKVAMTKALICALVLVVLLAGIIGLRFVYVANLEHRALRLHRKQAQIMRGLLNTFMDVQNNLLNNMVYFRTKIACDLPFDDDDIRMIDDEIDQAKKKLAQLVSTGIGTTRDLGGIVVVDVEDEGDREAA